jgi:hypothetical protein
MGDLSPHSHSDIVTEGEGKRRRPSLVPLRIHSSIHPFTILLHSFFYSFFLPSSLLTFLQSLSLFILPTILSSFHPSHISFISPYLSPFFLHSFYFSKIFRQTHSIFFMDIRSKLQSPSCYELFATKI